MSAIAAISPQRQSAHEQLYFQALTMLLGVEPSGELRSLDTELAQEILNSIKPNPENSEELLIVCNRVHDASCRHEPWKPFAIVWDGTEESYVVPEDLAACMKGILEDWIQGLGTISIPGNSPAASLDAAEVEKAKAYNEACGRLIPPCLYRNGTTPQGDEEVTSLTKFLGSIIVNTESYSQGEGYVRLTDISKYLGGDLGAGADTAFAAWDDAVRGGIAIRVSQGYFFGRPFIAELEKATGKSFSEAKALYLQTRATGERKLG